MPVIVNSDVGLSPCFQMKDQDPREVKKRVTGHKLINGGPGL